MNPRNLLIAASITLLTVPLFSQSQPEGKRALAHVARLADDRMQGRKSGTEGYLKAADYAASHMKRYGLRPAVNDSAYFQQVPFKRWSNFRPPARLEMTAPKRKAYTPGRSRDFMPLNGTGSGVVRGKAVFAGFGLVSDTASWNDYRNLDVTGKIVMLLPGAPDSLTALPEKERSLDRKIRNAAARNAAAVVLINTDGRLRWRRSPDDSTVTPLPEGFLVMAAAPHVCDDIFYTDGGSWRWLASETIRTLTPRHRQLGVTLELEAHYEEKEVTAPNVIGILPGTDEQLGDEYIIIGGHLDHLGVGPGGEIYNGADDNAGSAAIILEIARVLKETGFRPRRTLVFACWAGEELGLAGSRFYAENPLFPLDRTAVYLNIDMAGSGSTDLTTGGMWEFSRLFALAEEGMPKDIHSRLRYRYDYGGSDHSAFLRKGVKSFSLRTGKPLTGGLDDEHPEYHKPGDTVQIMSAEILELAARYCLHKLTAFANTDADLMDPSLRAEHVHKNAFVVDLHCDTINRLLAGDDLTADNSTGHVDIPKLKQGAVDLQVFACFVGPPRNREETLTAAKRAFRQIDAVHQLVRENPEDMHLIQGSGDLRQLRGNRKTGALIGIEGGYAIENDLRLLRSFYRSGVRLMTLTHWTRTDWADASGDSTALFSGLTGFGEDVVREMNNLGMIIDLSHAHDSSFYDVLRITEAPVVASHSCCRALSDHHRNLSDDMLRALAENGGVIGINFAVSFLDTRTDGDPSVRVDVGTVADHIEHVIEVTGSSRHVCLGSDFDGIDRTPEGLEHIGRIPAITAELMKRGHSDADIKNILGGNFLRVLRQVERTAARLQKDAAPGS